MPPRWNRGRGPRGAWENGGQAGGAGRSTGRIQTLGRVATAGAGARRGGRTGGAPPPAFRPPRSGPAWRARRGAAVLKWFESCVWWWGARCQDGPWGGSPPPARRRTAAAQPPGSVRPAWPPTGGRVCLVWCPQIGLQCTIAALPDTAIVCNRCLSYPGELELCCFNSAKVRPQKVGWVTVPADSPPSLR